MNGANVLAAEAMSNATIVAALVAALGLILLNGFYVAYEFAILAARRSSFEGSGPVDSLARAGLADVSMQLAGAQLGITIASLALGHISEPALEVIIERVVGDAVSPETARWLGFTVSLGIFTALHLIFGEMVPKNIALAAPDATLRLLVIPYRAYLFVFRPVVTLLNSLANLAARAVGIQPRDELQSVHTASELAAIVTRSTEEGAIEADDAELIQGVLEFAERPVAEIATDLENYPSVDVGATAAQFERAVVEGGRGRVVVRDPYMGFAPVGYLHSRDLLEIALEDRGAPMPASAVRPMAIVPAERSLVNVLVQLRKAELHLALVTHNKEPIGVVSQSQVVRALVEPS